MVVLEICKEFVPFSGFVSYMHIVKKKKMSTAHFFFPKKPPYITISVQIRLRDYGVLDFDAGDARRQPPVDTTWQQVFGTSIFSPYNFSYISLFLMLTLLFWVYSQLSTISNTPALFFGED